MPAVGGAAQRRSFAEVTRAVAAVRVTPVRIGRYRADSDAARPRARGPAGRRSGRHGPVPSRRELGTPLGVGGRHPSWAPASTDPSRPACRPVRICAAVSLDTRASLSQASNDSEAPRRLGCARAGLRRGRDGLDTGAPPASPGRVEREER